MKKFNCILITIFFFSLSLYIFPVTSNSSDTTFKILHNDKDRSKLDIEICERGSNDPKKTIKLKKLLKFNLKSGETISFKIKNPNPFLYEYNWTGIKKEKNPNFKILEKFIESLSTIEIKETNEKKKQNGSTNNEISCLKSTQHNVAEKLSILLEHIIFLKNNKYKCYLEKAKEWEKLSITATEGDKKIIKEWDMQKKIVEVNSLYEEIDKFQIKFLEDKINKNTEVLANKLLKEELYKKDLEKKKSTKKNSKEKKLLQKEIFRIESNISELREYIDSIGLLLDIVSFTKTQEKFIKGAFYELKKFERIYCDEFLVERDFGEEITYDPKYDFIASFEIQKIKQNKSKKEKPSKYELHFSPYSLLRYQFGYCLVSRIEDNKIKDGKQGTYFLSMPMLTISLEKLKNKLGGIFTLAFQIGATMEDNSLFLNFGAGVMIKESFFLGAGYSFQLFNKERNTNSIYISVGLPISSSKGK